MSRGQAIEAGADIINDITGGRGDPAMLPLVAECGAGFIIMHMQGTPRTMQQAPHYEDVVAEVREFFRQQYARALSSGIDPMVIAFDPGIGFGKTLQHNLELLRNFARLRIEDRPLAVGVSRKSFLGKLIGSNEMSGSKRADCGVERAVADERRRYHSGARSEAESCRAPHRRKRFFAPAP